MQRIVIFTVSFYRLTGLTGLASVASLVGLIGLISMTGLTSVSCQANSIHETIVAPLPTQQQIRDWSATPGTRSYLIQVNDPYSDELLRLEKLEHWDRLRIESARYPSEADQAAWQALAKLGAEWIGLGSGYPTDAEVERLNAIGFRKILLVLPSYPGPEDASRVGSLKGEVAITFAAGAYPKYLEKPGFSALPSAVPLLFVTDYWPAYSHMDFFNLISQPISLRVSGSMPPAESLPYLAAIQRLTSIAIETTFDPPSADWKALAFVRDLRWTSQGRVPSREALAEFSGPGRSLIIDQDEPLSDVDHRSLEGAGIPIEWIHAPL